MDAGGAPRAGGKLEALPKDDLLKFIKRQALNSKDLKKKITDLEDHLDKEKQEVARLDTEKKEWISRGVSAEFEKKDKLVRKDRELELAARLAADMLEENDELRGNLQEQKKESEVELMEKDDEIDKLFLAKEALQNTLKTMREEFESTVMESQELREKLQTTEDELRKFKDAVDENEILKLKIKDLERQLANPQKLNKLKGDYDELGKENKLLREAKILAEQDRKVKSEQILNFDKEIQNLRKELADKNKIIKEKKVAMEVLKVSNEELIESLRTSEMKVQDLEGEVTKSHVEKEKFLKAIKSMKTKFERSSLIEEELRKQLNTIVGERDELIKKNLKRNQVTQKQKAKENTDTAKKGEALEKTKDNAGKGDLLEELRNQIVSLEGENIELKEVIESHDKKTEEVLSQYETVKKDFDNVTFELDELTAIKNEYVEEKEKLTVEKEKLNNQLQSYKTELDEACLQSTTTTQQNEILNEQLKNLQADIDSLTEEMSEMTDVHKKSSEEFVKEKETLQEVIKSLQGDIDTLNNELDEITAAHQVEKEEMKKEKETISKEKETHSAELQALQSDVDTCNKELNELTASHLLETEELRKEKEIVTEELRKEKVVVVSERDALSKELKSIKEKSEEHHGNEVEKDEEEVKEELAKALEENGTLRKEFEDIEAEVDMYRRGAPETKANLLKLETRVDELLNQLQTLNEEKLNQEAALEELFKSHDDLSNKYDFECKEREKKEKEVCHLEEQLSMLESKEGKEKSTVDLEQEVSMLQETIDDISTSKDHVQQELQLKEQLIQQLRNDIEVATTKQQTSVNEDMENVLYEMNNIRTQLLAVTKELEICQNKKESLQSMITEAVSERDQSIESLSVIEEQLIEAKQCLDVKVVECEELRQSIESIAVVEDQLIEAKQCLDIKVVECEELRQQVIEHSTPNNSIHMDNTQEDMLNLQRDLEYLDQQYKQVSFENLQLKEEFQTLIAAKTEHQYNFDEIKIKVDQYKKENTSLKDTIVQYNELAEKYGYDNIYDFDVFVSSLNSDVLTSTKMVQCLTTEKELADSRCCEMENSLNTSCVSLTEKDENVNRMENELLNLQNEYEYMSQQNCNIIEEKDREISEKQNEIEQLCNEIKEYSEKITSSADTDLDTRKENQQLRVEIEKCRDFQFENEQLTQNIEKCREELANLKQALNEAHLEMMDLKTSEENHSNEIREKHIQIGELKAELIGLRESFENEQEKFTQSENTCNKLENQLHEKEGNVTQLSCDLAESLNETEEFKSKEDESNENWNVFIQRYEELQEKCRYLQDCNTGLETANGTLVEDMGAMYEEKEGITHEVNKLTSINTNVENKLQEALNKVVSMQQELSDKCEAVNSMDALLKEKGDKGSKFKMVAIKAKKELESQRSKFLEEKGSFEQQVNTLKEEVTYLEKELVRQKTECSKHEEEFEEFESEIKDLKCKLMCGEESLKSMEESFTSRSEECQVLKQLLQDSEAVVVSKEVEIEKLNVERETIQKQLDTLLKEGETMNLMNLEIVDYERTVTNLNAKLDVKEKQYIEARDTIEKITEIQKTMESEISSLKKESGDLDEKNQKLKAMVVKLKKDVGEKQKQEEETEVHVNQLNLTIETMKHMNEDMKIEIMGLAKEKMDIKEKMRDTVEHHEKNYQTLEVKFARVSNDLLTSQRENQSLAQEFEQYKIRAHNVLKQQKSKHSEEEKDGENQQILLLEEITSQLRDKLVSSNDSLRELQSTHNELEAEHDNLQSRHHEFIEEVTEKEFAWKQKLTQVKLDASTKVLEYQDKLQLLQNDNERIQMEAKEREERDDNQSMESNVTQELTCEEKEKYETEINRLTEELERIRKRRLESPPNNLLINKQESLDSTRNDSIEFKSVSERQEGEGMDSKELEIIDTLSLHSQRSSASHTPLSPSNASVLERLLSPMEVPFLSSPQTPNSMKEELTVAKGALQTAMKKNEHMTLLIRESEGNACRLADQAKVLKDEIRRLERNEEREQALSNMEYLKNVIIKFLKVGPVEKEQLIPVLSTMLKLSDDEKKFVFEYAKGEDGEDPEGAGGSWSSYVYRWTSLS